MVQPKSSKHMEIIYTINNNVNYEGCGKWYVKQTKWSITYWLTFKENFKKIYRPKKRKISRNKALIVF